eukprot:TRINITY_DN13775_c0_g1_i1.p1 TRINITY_DN13775_c0_g1~~TRINITY_DN13775_c0_g1_i1.p1  ORF type:complete len:384 (+),score=44.10 TRINITY_DN13775_c0_g1_i1:51-1202(+)
MTAINVGELLDDRHEDILRVVRTIPSTEMTKQSTFWKRRARSGIRTSKKGRNKTDLTHIKRQWTKKYMKRSNSRAVIKARHSACVLCDESDERSTVRITGRGCLSLLAYITTPDSAAPDTSEVESHLLQSKVFSSALYLPVSNSQKAPICPSDILIISSTTALLSIPTSAYDTVAEAAQTKVTVEAVTSELWSIFGSQKLISDVLQKDLSRWDVSEQSTFISFKSNYHNVWNKGSASVTSILQIGRGLTSRKLWEALYRHRSTVLMKSSGFRHLEGFEEFPATWNRSPLFMTGPIALPTFMYTSLPDMVKVSLQVIGRGTLQQGLLVYLKQSVTTMPVAVGVVVQVDFHKKHAISFLQRDTLDQDICCWNGGSIIQLSQQTIP